jgi:hypothetical protein
MRPSAARPAFGSVALAVLSAIAVACAAPPGAASPSADASASPSADVASDAASAEASTPASLPALPADLPLPPGAVEAEVPSGDPATIASWTVEGGDMTPFDFFSEALPPAGFPIDLAAPGGEAAVIRFRTPGGQALQLDITGFDPVRIDLRPVHD